MDLLKRIHNNFDENEFNPIVSNTKIHLYTTKRSRFKYKHTQLELLKINETICQQLRPPAYYTGKCGQVENAKENSHKDKLF